MLKFFRTIRQKLIEEDKLRTYFLYAAGEILLVVVGILIALQVNNWNEGRKAFDQEQSTLISLNQEVENNHTITNNCHKDIQLMMNSADKIRSLISPAFPDIAADTLNTWLGITGVTMRCFIVTDIMDELQSSGNLKIIRNVELRRQIGSWLSTYEDLRKEEQEWEREFSREYIPFTNKWIAWDDVDYMFNKEDPAYFEKRFNIDPRPILQEFEFSNVFSIHYWRMRRIRNRITNLRIETIKLSELINTNIAGQNDY